MWLVSDLILSSISSSLNPPSLFQTISADWVLNISKVLPGNQALPELRTFGFSLSSGVDVDANDYHGSLLAFPICFNGDINLVRFTFN